MYKPRLLRETAEIALTEIKRFIEPRIAEEFSLRRVSAPLYLPADSGDNDPGEAVKFTLPGHEGEMQIVRGLDRWLRTQLVRYDIAPGFGVFTVMNAIRPEVQETATTSPHLSAWAWQQVLDPAQADTDRLVASCKRLYQILLETEQKIREKLPHLEDTLPQRLHVTDASEINRLYPEASQERSEYLHHRDNSSRALLIVDGSRKARIVVWNSVVGRPLTLAETAITTRRPVVSIGGNILRDPLAMQILHQPHLLR